MPAPFIAKRFKMFESTQTPEELETESWVLSKEPPPAMAQTQQEEDPNDSESDDDNTTAEPTPGGIVEAGLLMGILNGFQAQNPPKVKTPLSMRPTMRRLTEAHISPLVEKLSLTEAAKRKRKAAELKRQDSDDSSKDSEDLERDKRKIAASPPRANK